MKAHNFPFTKNNYLEHGGYPDITPFKYICWGEETCPKTGTPHLQGFVQLKQSYTLRQVSKLLPHCHIEIMHGTCAEARDYTRKHADVKWVEYGVFSDGQGCRTDIRGATQQIAEGAMMDEIDPVVFVRYHQGLSRYADLITEKRDWKPEVIVFWGKPGTGKSRRVRELAGLDACYKPGMPKWWDGYDRHEVVVINDFSWRGWLDAQDVGRQTTLDIFDCYPCKVKIHGGYKELVARRMYLTTNENPHLEWPAEMLRRVTELHEVT